MRISERFQIAHWDDVAGKIDPSVTLYNEHNIKGASVFNSFVLISALKEIYDRHPGLETYEGAGDVSLELWETKKDATTRLIVRIGSLRYIIAPKLPSEPIKMPNGEWLP